jgi:hypothetical protein
MAANTQTAQQESTVAPPGGSAADHVDQGPGQDTSTVLLDVSAQNSQQETAATPRQFPVTNEPNPPPLVKHDGNYRPGGYIFSDGEQSSGG